MSHTKVKDARIDGVVFPIYVTDTGDFYTELHDRDSLKAPTLKALEEKLRKLQRQQGVRVPVTLLHLPHWNSDKHKPLRVEHGYLYGIHASNDRLLYCSDAGEKQILGSYYDGELCRRLTDAEVEQVQETWAAKVAAENAWERVEESLKVNGAQLLAEAAERRERGTAASNEETPA